MLDRRRLAHILVVMAGIYVVHAAAYAIAHPDPLARAVALGGHAYLDVVGYLIAPAMAVGVGALALRHAKDVGLQINARGLATSIALGFLGVETVERLATAPLSVVTEPAVFVGLALAVPVAVLSTTLIRVASEVARVFVHRRRSRPRQRGATIIWSPVEAVAIPRFTSLSRIRRRGPPGVVPAR